MIAVKAPKTPAFWQIVGSGSASEDAELADLLDKLGNPAAVTLAQLRAKANANFDVWLSARRNRRAIPHRMTSCGYVPVRNPDTDDGLWRIRGYARPSTPRQRCPTSAFRHPRNSPSRRPRQ